jgi:hypothetical protein
MPRPVFPQPPVGFAHGPHPVSVYPMPARWVMIDGKRRPNLGSEENRCETQQRNPCRLRSPQEASSCQVDRCFIRQKRASQRKMRLHVDFLPQIERQILAIEIASRQQ